MMSIVKLAITVFIFATLVNTTKGKECDTKLCQWKEKLSQRFGNFLSEYGESDVDNDEDQRSIESAADDADDTEEEAEDEELPSKRACGSMCIWKGKRDALEKKTAHGYYDDVPQPMAMKCRSISCRILRNVREMHEKKRSYDGMTSYRCNTRLCHWRMNHGR